MSNSGGFTSDRAVDVVQYQPGSIVSKEILKRQAGTVTAFAFDRGQGLSEHTAPFDALVLIVDGTAEITIGTEARQFSAGSLVLMPANIPHALTAVDQFKMLLIMIRSQA